MNAISTQTDSETSNGLGSITIAPGAFLERAGIIFTRYSLALVLIWIGGMKFTAYEAGGIKPFVENSPLMSFFYQFTSVRHFSGGLGVVEIIIGLMIASRPWLPKVSALASVLTIGMFLTTLSFLITTPGAFEPSEGGFPALSVPGQFLLKDFVLLGAGIITLGDALKKISRS